MAASLKRSFHGISSCEVVKSDDEDVGAKVIVNSAHGCDKDGGGGGGWRHLVVEGDGGGAEDVVTRYEVVLLAVLSSCDHSHHQDHQRLHHAKGVPGLFL